MEEWQTAASGWRPNHDRPRVVEQFARDPWVFEFETSLMPDNPNEWAFLWTVLGAAGGAIGAVTGVVGAATGIMALRVAQQTLAREVQRDQVRLDVYVRGAASLAVPEEMLAITVVNQSAFTVVIRDVGLLGPDFYFPVPHWSTHDGRRFPVSMEPRTQIDVMFFAEMLRDPQIRSATQAYAQTACGTRTISEGDTVSGLIKRANDNDRR